MSIVSLQSLCFLKSAGITNCRMISLFQVFSLLMVWNSFSREANPKYRKQGGYASALEYIVTSSLNISTTKSDIAKKHEVSVATLTRNSGQIQDFMDGVAIRRRRERRG